MKRGTCDYCGVRLPKRHSRFCSLAHNRAWWMEQRRIPLPKRPCTECGTLFKPKRRGSLYCTQLCGIRGRLNQRYFGGKRQAAVGFYDKVCWVCGKTKLRKPHVHHVVGRADSQEPLVVLCYSCHALVGRLGQRNFLEDPHMVADLITLARFVKGLPDARTIVKYEGV